MGMKLYDYQHNAILQISEAWHAGAKRVLLRIETGGGKTVTFSAMAQRAIAKNIDTKILFVSHRFELLAQAVRTFERFGLVANVLCQRKDFEKIRTANAIFQSGKRVESNILACMVQTLKNAVKNGKIDFEPKLIIIDEVHFGHFREIFSMFPNAYFLGVTATPISAKKSDPLSNYFAKMVEPTNVEELISRGFLMKPKAIRGVSTADRKKLEKDAKGEFTDESQMREFQRENLKSAIAAAYEEIKHRKGLIFCVNIEHAEQVSAQLGIPSYHSKKSDEELFEIMRKYKSGETRWLATVAILTTGFDDPPTDAAIISRCTTSLPLFLQIIGRIVRPFDGKQQPIVYDLGGNFEEFGIWHGKRDWQKLFLGEIPKQKAAGAAGAKNCPQCQALILASARTCEYCGFELPKKEKKAAELSHFEEVSEKKIAIFEKSVEEIAAEFSGSANSGVQMIFKKALSESAKNPEADVIVIFSDLLWGYATAHPNVEKIKGWCEHQKKIWIPRFKPKTTTAQNDKTF